MLTCEVVATPVRAVEKSPDAMTGGSGALRLHQARPFVDTDRIDRVRGPGLIATDACRSHDRLADGE